MLSEGQRARIFCGITAQEFDNLPGSHTWAVEETSIGVFDCKADVIMFYRTETQMNNVADDISTKKK